MWIQFYQTPYDTVKYRTSETDQEHSMTYKRFKEFIYTFRILNRFNFQNALDRFDTVILDTDTGEWRYVEMELSVNDYTFEELFKLNDPEKKKLEARQTKDSKWTGATAMIKNMWDQRKRANRIVGSFIQTRGGRR